MIIFIICNVIFLEPHKNKGKIKTPLSQEALEFLKSKLSMEYDLYRFLVNRLKLQSRTLKLWRLNKLKKPVIYKPTKNGLF